MELSMIAPCLFGLEGLVAEELRRLHMKTVEAENGRVLFSGTEADVARANINLRCAERVLLEMGQFSAASFDALFEGVKALPWERYLPRNAAFPVKGYALNSRLHSVPDCQKIIKKAIVERLKLKYAQNWFSEDGPLYQVQFSLLKDWATISIDTSGPGLHKRGWRAVGVAAPLRETLAAGMVMLSRYRGKGAFCDPFCGSGTIAIEAALAACNRAPGLGRRFAAQAWPQLPAAVWTQAKEEAREKEFHRAYEIWGGDLDPGAIAIAESNAKKAGVGDLIRFQRADARQFAPRGSQGVVVTNPPYGERLLEKKEAAELVAAFGKAYGETEGFRLYLLSSDQKLEHHFGRKAGKKAIKQEEKRLFVFKKLFVKNPAYFYQRKKKES